MNTTKKKKYAFVEFKFSIPAMGYTEDELKEHAVEQLLHDEYEIMKDLRRYPEYAEIGEVIDEAEISDYFLGEDEEE